jgi:Icc-related predicted phosphoesterase
MRILSLKPELLLEIPFLNAGRGAGSFYEDLLPLHEGFVDHLPEGIEALIATADLQGRERFQDQKEKGPLRLLGEALAERLETEILPRFRLPPTHQTGVLLAGDFYTVPALDKRGGSGDVTAVWEAFADRFAFVAGVPGNHDTFGSSLEPPRHLANLPNVHYLDGDISEIHGLTVAGIGGIIGNPAKPHRRTDDDYLHLLRQILEHQPDILIAHDGPDAPAQGYRGSSLVRELLEASRPNLVIRGHAHWKEPLVELPGGTQILNVDARLVILREKTVT